MWLIRITGHKYSIVPHWPDQDLNKETSHHIFLKWVLKPHYQIIFNTILVKQFQLFQLNDKKGGKFGPLKTT